MGKNNFNYPVNSYKTCRFNFGHKMSILSSEYQVQSPNKNVCCSTYQKVYNSRHFITDKKLNQGH